MDHGWTMNAATSDFLLPSFHHQVWLSSTHRYYFRSLVWLDKPTLDFLRGGLRWQRDAMYCSNIRECLILLVISFVMEWCACIVQHVWSKDAGPSAVICSEKRKGEYYSDKSLSKCGLISFWNIFVMFQQISFTMLYISHNKMTRQKDGVLLMMMTKKMYPGCLTMSNVLNNRISHPWRREPNKDAGGISTTEHTDEDHSLYWFVFNGILPFNTLSAILHNDWTKSLLVLLEDGCGALYSMFSWTTFLCISDDFFLI